MGKVVGGARYVGEGVSVGSFAGEGGGEFLGEGWLFLGYCVGEYISSAYTNLVKGSSVVIEIYVGAEGEG